QRPRAPRPRSGPPPPRDARPRAAPRGPGRRVRRPAARAPGRGRQPAAQLHARGAERLPRRHRPARGAGQAREGPGGLAAAHEPRGGRGPSRRGGATTDGNPKATPFKVHAITPMQFCSTPAVGTHKRPCNRADADNKFMGATLLANSTNHGFRWLLLGDDDTTFNLETIEQALEEFNPKDPHYFGISKLGQRGNNQTRPAGYETALSSCPKLRPDDGLRLWSVNLTSDITDVNKDCDPMPFRDDSWFQWAKGGDGIILSAGLVDSIASSDWQQCVDRIVTFGGDVRIALCLALLGHRVEKLEDLRARLASSASTSWTWASPASTSPSTPRAASVATWCRR
ncbi:unnamed protein product, partial [Prorocentrum cordatum]